MTKGTSNRGVVQMVAGVLALVVLAGSLKAWTGPRQPEPDMATCCDCEGNCFSIEIPPGSTLGAILAGLGLDPSQYSITLPLGSGSGWGIGGIGGGGAIGGGGGFGVGVRPPGPQPIPTGNYDDNSLRRTYTGADGRQYTAYPVRFVDGAAQMIDEDFAGIGSAMKHTRSYKNRMAADYEGPNGWNWYVAQMPELVVVQSGGQDAMVLNGPGESAWFDRNMDGSFTTRYNLVNTTLVHDEANDVYVVSQKTGRGVLKLEFHDAGKASPFVPFRGCFKRMIEPSGVVTEVLSYNNYGWIEGIARTVSTTVEKIEYTYSSNRIQYATLTRQVGAGGAVPIRRIAYSYYGSSEDFGSLADLKTATVQKPDGSGGWTNTATTYYRYWKSGDTDFDTKGVAHGLKYVLGPEAFRKAEVAGDPFTMTNTALGAYADHYFEYEPSTGGVSKEVTSGGCGTCGGGGAGGTSGDTFVRVANANYPSPATDPMNTWKWKTTYTHADNHVEIVYTNIQGLTMLRDFQVTQGESTLRWYEFYKYNAKGQRILHAHPSAITGYDDDYDDLLHWDGDDYEYLADSAGLIEMTDYYSSTGGSVDEDTSGGVVNYVQFQKIKNGESGTAIKLQEFEYYKHVDGDDECYPLAKLIVYPSDSDQNKKITTTFSYEWDGMVLTQRTITLPKVPTSQNGAGDAAEDPTHTIVEVYDDYGNLTWRKDACGFITYMAYDVTRGILSQRIDDVQTTSISGEPGEGTGGAWVTPAGGGLHLTTNFDYDAQNRLTEVLSPVHSVDLSGTATNVRAATWHVYQENAPDVLDERWTGQGYWNTSNSSYTLINPVHLTRMDKKGRSTDQITVKRASTSGKLLASDTLSQSNYQRWSSMQYNDLGQVTSTRVYHTIPTPSGEGTGGPNYDQTTYSYDTTTRSLQKILSPDGTITRMVYDAHKRVTSVWVGLDDTDATATDPSDGGTNSMRKISENQYDGGSDKKDGNLTQVTLYEDGSTTRVTTYGYDWRNRRIWADGEVDHYAVNEYDNLDRVIKIERYDTDDEGDLISRAETLYDDQGRVYRTIVHAVDPTDGSVGYSLTGNNWYDACGRLIKSIAPGAGKVASKSVYDGLGRMIKQYSGYDTDESLYGDTDDVDGDTILSQVETSYDGAGCVLQITTRQRLHDDTNGTGNLSTARVSYLAFWCDGIGRSVAAANYGTNGGSSFTRSGTIPTASDSVLLSTTIYDDAGEVLLSTDPKAVVTKRIYDQMGRLKYLVENYANFDESDESDTGDASDKSKDRVTKYVYTSGHLTQQIALDPNADGNLSDNQATNYVYEGTTLSNSDIASNALLRAVIYPDADDPTSLSGNGGDGTFDRVELTYNRLGEVKTSKDQRGTVHTYIHDKLGRLTEDRITTVGSGVDNTILAIVRSYEVRGMLASVTSYNHATTRDAGNVKNVVTLSYNDFGQLISDTQDHKGTTSAISAAYSYTDGSSSSNQIRPTKLTYPNSRELHYLYSDAGGGNTIGDALSRITALATDTTRGTSDANVIAAYTYLGLDQMVVKDYSKSSLKLKLDYFGGGSSGTYAGLDDFGRITSQDWVNYQSGTVHTMQINHSYDRDSNRLKADNQVYAASSQVYSYDGLQRLSSVKDGVISGGDIPTWKKRQQDWTLDAVGNQLAVAEDGASDWVTHTPNAANEYTYPISDDTVKARKVKGNAANAAAFSETFANNNFGWDKPGGSSDDFDVTSGHLIITTVAQDTYSSITEPAAAAFVTAGPGIGAASATLTIKFPLNTTSGKAGYVFGYKSPNDYWIHGYEISGGGSTKTEAIWHVNSGYMALIDSRTASFSAGSYVVLYHFTRTFSSDSFIDYGGYPTGKVGFFTTVENTEFDDLKLYPHSGARDMAGRWNNYAPPDTSGNLNAIDASTDVLKLSADSPTDRPILLKGINLSRFTATFCVKRVGSAGSAGDHGLYFLMMAQTHMEGGFTSWTGDMEHVAISIDHNSSKAPNAYVVSPFGHFQEATYNDRNSGNMPPGLGTTATDLWVKVVNEADQFGQLVELRVYCADEETDLATASPSLVNIDEWDATNSGLIGFMARGQQVSVSNVTIKDANGTTIHYDPFTLNASGQAEEKTLYDAAGNLTYDGVYSYAYDAWNRLVTVKKAYRDSGGTLQSPITLSTHSYDGQGRRISKAITNTGFLNGTYHYYYDGQRLIETRNGSSQVVKQQVWGTRYIDELVQIALNGTPASDNSCFGGSGDASYWAMHDANWNIIGVTDSSGVLVERYEYTPYGQRQVFVSTGTADPACDTPWARSKRRVISSIAQPYGLCEFGHQGLMHEEEADLVSNRTRVLNTATARYNQRDLLRYVDGMNTYEYVRSAPMIQADPFGLAVIDYDVLVQLVGGCYPALPANASPARQAAYDQISPEVLLCLMWQESSFDTGQISPTGNRGLGQLNKATADDVDRAFGLAVGTTWKAILAGDPCDQIAATAGALLHKLVNKNDFGHDGSLGGGLKAYGPVDAPFGEYAGPILECAKCLNAGKKKAQQVDDGNASLTVCSKATAQECFNNLNEAVQEARKQRLK